MSNTSNTPDNFGSDSVQGDRHHQEDRFLINDLPPMSEANARNFLTESVDALVEATKDDEKTGSTFTGAIVTEEGNVVTAHLGDSPAAIVIYDPHSHTTEIKQLTTPHTPIYNEYIQDIPGSADFQLNGRIWHPLTNGKYVSIALTHALGDSEFGDSLSHEPDMQTHDLSEYRNAGKQIFLLTASDGALIDTNGTLSLQPHIDIIQNLLTRTHQATPQEIAEAIANQSHARHHPKSDNVTVTLTPIIPGRSSVSAIFDGHGGEKTAETAVTLFSNIVNDINQSPEQSITLAVNWAKNIAKQQRLIQNFHFK